MKTFSRISGMCALLALTACTAVPYSDDGTMMTPPDAYTPQGEVTAPVIPHVSQACDAIAAAPANTTETYMNAGTGIRFTFPYNQTWSQGDTPFAPYIESVPTDNSDGIVSFGTPTMDMLATTCDLMHEYQMTVLPAQTSDRVIRRIRAEGSETSIVPDAKVETINGLTVVRYSPPGLCAYPTLEVVGTSHNYSFSTNCGKGTDEEWVYLENVVKTVELEK